jgi:hypothetical protein
MGLLDRLRSQPEWRHPDAGVRLAAVSALDAAAQDVLAAVAREDADARVRRAAVRRLGDVTALAVLARADADETVRVEAARGLLAFAVDGNDESLALNALEGLTDPRDLVTVARSAVLSSVSLAALDRATDARTRGHVARRSVHAATRQRAIEAIDDPSELADVALRTEFRDTGVAAAERLSDAGLLGRIAERARNKAVARRASQLLRQLSPEPRPVAEAIATDRVRQSVLCEAVEALATLESDEAIERELAAGIDGWNELVPAIDDDLADRFAAACEAARSRLRLLQSRRRELERAARDRAEAIEARLGICRAIERARGDEPAEFLSRQQEGWVVQGTIPEADAARLNERFQEAVTGYERRQSTLAAAQGSLPRIVADIEQLAQEGSVFRGDRAALDRWKALLDEWQSLPASLVEQHPAEADRVRQLDTRVGEREAEARAERERRRRSNLSRLEQFCLDTEGLLASESLALKDASRRERQIQSLLDNPPHLPTDADQQVMAERLKGLQLRLAPRVQELREIDEWARWANVGVQEELCARVEALKAASDPSEIARELRNVEQRWRQASAVPREKAQTLWRRYRAAHDELRGRINEHFAQLASERASNLKRKEELVSQAEALSGSTDWIKTAEAIQRLQSDWKSVGTASPADERLMWERFRAACNLFFTRRREDLVARKRSWSENLARKEALCARAEELADSSDWDVVAIEIRKLQSEWKTVGPVRRNRSEAVWQRFRAACDRFFERYQHRGQLDLQQRLTEREALCREVEALAADASQLPEDLAAVLQSAIGRWQKSPVLPRTSIAELETRFKSALDRVVTAQAERLRGTDFDARKNQERMEQLCARVEELAGQSAPQAASPVELLAARWREALASTTIGGRVDDDARLRAAARDVRDARAAWERVGYVSDSTRRALTDRFERACRRFFDQRQRSGNTPQVGAPR